MKHLFVCGHGIFLLDDNFKQISSIFHNVKTCPYYWIIIIGYHITDREE